MASSLPSNKRFSKPKLLPRATSENFDDLRSAGSSFINPSNSFHMLDEQIELQAKLLNYFLGSNKSNINQNEINDVDDEGYVPD